MFSVRLALRTKDLEPLPFPQYLTRVLNDGEGTTQFQVLKPDLPPDTEYIIFELRGLPPDSGLLRS